MSLIGARGSAVLIDGIVLAMPAFGLAWLLSLVFPHRGFFFSEAAESGSGLHATTKLGASGILLVTAVSLSYFFVLEALSGQTIGKRAMGLCVRSSSGGTAGLNAISARTILRLIDVLPALYLLGALVAIVSGRRRRRIGDWAARTVVVREAELSEPSSRPSGWRVAGYPAIWSAGVIIAIFALGVGKAAGEGERAVALVRAYVNAREHGNANLACSLLTAEQQRDLVAIQARGLSHAQAQLCPEFILRTDPRSHLLNPALAEMATEPLLTTYLPLGAVVVRSSSSNLELVAVPEHGQLKLDMRGVFKLGFVRECSQSGRLSTEACTCTFNLLRTQGLIPGEVGVTQAILARIYRDALRCRSEPAAAS